jgi:eukaryotic-like serine/threonine-protein kinase
MERGDESTDQFLTEVWKRHEDILRRFEDAWRAGQWPVIEEHLPPDDADRRGILVELVFVDMERRLELGEAIRAEAYLTRYPELQRDAEAALDLITAEFRIRQRRGEAVDPDDYFHRFPDLRNDLGARFQRPDPSSGRFRHRDTVVQKHLQHHADDAQRSLAAVSSLGSPRELLRRIDDSDLQESLARVPLTQDGDTERQTVLPPPTERPAAVGASTSWAGRFRVLRPHAKGGLGEVFVARDEELGREVALKQIQDHYADDPESRSRFVLEAEVTGGLEHPGVVPVYGLGKSAGGRPFYAMRFVKGDSLKDAIKRYYGTTGKDSATGERALQFRRLLGRFVDVCNAIAYAHSRGVLHRDLKPGNVMLGPYGETLVVDWGLAKIMGRPGEDTRSDEPRLRPDAAGGTVPTVAGSSIGTPQFMSPEQAAGKLDQLGPATDIYSLGATLYCLLTGSVPFQDENLTFILVRVQMGVFRPPRSVKPDVPKALEAICLKAMALRPEDRYPTARALADDIESWLADELVAAYHEPMQARLLRWARHHKPFVTGAAALLVTAVIGLGVGFVLVDRERLQTEERRREAVEQREKADEARKLADENAKVAERASKVSQDTLLTVVTNVGEFVKKYPDAEPLKDQILTLVQAGLDKVAKAYANSALEWRTVGGIFQRKGDMFGRAGKTKEALEQYEKGLAVFQKMVTELPPADPQREIGQYNLAVAHTKMGDIDYKQGNAAAAHEHYQEALRLRKGLAEAKLKSPELQNPAIVLGAVASSYISLGNLSLTEGDLARARDDFRGSHEIQEKLVVGPKDLEGRHALASSLNGLAELSFRLNDRPTTQKYYLDLLKLMQELSAADPINVEFKKDLATCHEKLGDINLFWGQDLPKTLAEYQRGHDIREALLKREPTSADLQAEFATSNYRLGTANLWLGRKSESEKCYQDSLKFREKLSPRDPTNTHRKLELMLSLARCGQHTKAAELADAIRKATSGDSAFLFSAACGYALSIPAVAHGKDKDKLTPEERALQQRYADKAIDTLREALAKRFDDPVTLETDPDLAPMQNDPRLKELLAKMKKR